MNFAPSTVAEPSLDWIRTMLPLVKRIAASFTGRLGASMSLEDLIGVGFVALIELQRRHPALPPEELQRLGAARVRGAMLDEMRKGDPLSRRTRQRARQIDRATADFEARSGRAPTEAELSSALGISRQATAEARLVARRSASRGDDQEAIAQLPSTAGLSPEDETHRGERLARCQRGVEGLPGRQRRMVELYFGEERTLRQIGEQFGVTEARVSQLLSGAVKQLRVSCASMPPPPA